MASWNNDASLYYAASWSELALSQGDIVLAPTAFFFPGRGEREAVAPELGDSRTIHVWTGSEDGKVISAPTLSVEVTWSPAMVIPHTCAMEKEWNERVHELARTGIPQEEAEAQATADPYLDAVLLIAPIKRYEGLPDRRQRSILSGNRLGEFPVPGTNVIPAGYVDLNAITAVHHTLVPIDQRIAVLSEIARAYLQRALVLHFAWRHDSALADIESAIGRTIIDSSVIAVPSKKPSRVKVVLLLDDGTKLVLEGDAPSPVPGYVPERPPRRTKNPVPPSDSQ
ncbi:MAG TPA: hypothetical protein VGZ00_00825 [Candidatus Baltobacteraceae bacterium]|jgi:hypothetical protein|nr:hypothetical protein [Candidatus Baltobacteraceae bacterium]